VGTLTLAIRIDTFLFFFSVGVELRSSCLINILVLRLLIQVGFLYM